MYYYKFESIDFEEQYAFELTHWKKFSSQELDGMVMEAIKTYVQEDYTPFPFDPYYLSIGTLFFDGTLQDTLVRLFGFEKIDFESRIEYGGEALFRDDFRHRDGKNFRELLKDVKVPECGMCIREECLIDNKRF